MLIKILSAVINDQKSHKVIVLGGCYLSINVIRKIDPKIVKDFLNETVSNFCIKDGLTTSILLKNGIELRFSYKTTE